MRHAPIEIPSLWLPRPRRGAVLVDGRLGARSRSALALLNAGRSPGSISGLQLWLKADAGAYQDDAKTSPCTTDGQNFRGWADQSGQNTDVNSGGGANPPTYRINVLNGKPSMRGVVGQDCRLGINSNLGMLANVPGATAFVVLQSAALSSANSYLNLRGPSALRFQMGRGQTVASSDNFQTRRLDADTTDVRGAAAGSVYTPGAWGYVTAIADYANGARYLYRNGVLLDSVTGLATGNTSNTNGALLSLGMGASNTGYDIAEIVVYNRALTSGERTGIEAYLRQRYAL